MNMNWAMSLSALLMLGTGVSGCYNERPGNQGPPHHDRDRHDRGRHDHDRSDRDWRDNRPDRSNR